MTMALVRVRRRNTAEASRARSVVFRSRKTCRRGHYWTAQNSHHETQWKYGRVYRVRRCVACLTLWAHAKKRVSIAFSKMVAAHPDKGGTVTKFLKAHQAYLRAKAA